MLIQPKSLLLQQRTCPSIPLATYSLVLKHQLTALLTLTSTCVGCTEHSLRAQSCISHLAYLIKHIFLMHRTHAPSSKKHLQYHARSVVTILLCFGPSLQHQRNFAAGLSEHLLLVHRVLPHGAGAYRGVQCSAHAHGGHVVLFQPRPQLLALQRACAAPAELHAASGWRLS